jgi:hypothetical protein
VITVEPGFAGSKRPMTSIAANQTIPSASMPTSPTAPGTANSVNSPVGTS